MSYSISRRIQFCCGHRVVGHETKCKNIHGHNYVLWVHARPKMGRLELDQLGRVIDFGVLKEKVGRWIDSNWDHGMVMWDQDPYVPLWIGVSKNLKVPGNDKIKYYLLDSNPTAENMARYLLIEVCPDLFFDYDIEVWKIVLYETENCYAAVRLQDER